MITTIIITALVIIMLAAGAFSFMWKLSRWLVIPMQILLFIILLTVVIKVFCTKENIEKLHTEISGSAVPAIEEKVMDTAMNEITENVSVKKQDNVPAEKNVIVEERSPEPAPVINEPVKSVQKKQTLFEQLK